MKLNQLVKDWLSEFKSDNENYSGFYTKYFGNKKFYQKLAVAIINKLEIEAICHQIYKFPTMKIAILDLMLLDLLPTILEAYLVASLSSNKNIKDHDNNGLFVIRTCLLSIFSLLRLKYDHTEDSDKELKHSLFFIPTFTDGSVFHSQFGRPDIDFLNSSVTVTQPNSPVNVDHQLIAGLIRIYNRFISECSTVSLDSFCSLATRTASLNLDPRIITTSDILSELLIGVYFVIHKGFHVPIATEALSAIEARANHEIMPSVILATNAVQNSLSSSILAMDTFIKPRSDTVVNDNIITNANFKPEKVSEDLVHLLDKNDNNPGNNPGNKSGKSVAGEPSGHHADLSEVSIHFKVPVHSSQGSKTGSKIKFSVKTVQNVSENRSHDNEAQL